MTREERIKYNYNLIHKTIDGVEYKLCSNKRHQEWLPMTEGYFYKWKYSKSDGFLPQCKVCTKEAVRERNEKDPDKHRKSSRNYRDKNSERYNDVAKQWREDNPERKHEYEIDYYIKNPDKFLVYIKNHRIHDITEAEWRRCLIVFDNQCAYCGLPIEKHIIKRNGKYIVMKLHKDHVDNEGYNDLRNAVPACRSCNSQKHDSNMEEWYKKQKFFSEEKLKFIYWWINEGYKEYIENKPPYKIIREKNKDNNNFHWNLWSVDRMRNTVEIIATKNTKKELKEDIKEYLDIIN